MAQTLLITGGNGYIGSHVAAAALRLGYNVRATVRSRHAEEQLRNTFRDISEARLSVFNVEDFTLAVRYRDALAGVHLVVHTASPFTFKPRNNQRDVLDPAIQGSLAILNAVRLYGRLVRRVVVVSSFAAVLDLSRGVRPGHTYTSDDWNPMSYSDACQTDFGMAAYCASKGLAEQAIWKWMDENKANISFTLACINPPWVFGPYVHSPDLNHLCESIDAVWNLLNTDTIPPSAVPAFADVRDVTRAILSALEKEEAGGHRFLIGSRFDWQTACDIIRTRFSSLHSRVPEGRPGSGSELVCYTLDCGPLSHVLGISLTSLETSLTETVAQLLEIQ